MYGETVFEPQEEAIRRIIITRSRIFTQIEKQLSCMAKPVFEPEGEAIRRIIIARSRIFTEIPIFLNTTKKTEPQRKFLSSTKYCYTNVFPERIKVA